MGHVAVMTRFWLVLPFALVLLPMPFLERCGLSWLHLPVALLWLFACIPLTSFCLWRASRS
ncbi:hypothetical protein ABUE34_08970 [Kozakia baliensis]|uniref:hypothetical protein n=1 Tax=Kozakia baliensis TaxID=153496 RepID=UPI0012491581